MQYNYVMMLYQYISFNMCLLLIKIYSSAKLHAGFLFLEYKHFKH